MRKHLLSSGKDDFGWGAEPTYDFDSKEGVSVRLSGGAQLEWIDHLTGDWGS